MTMLCLLQDLLQETLLETNLSMRLHLHGQSSWLEHEVWGHPWVALGVGSLVVLLLLLVVQLLLELGCKTLLLD